MPIDFTCPYCGLLTKVSDEYAGRSGPCAGCGQSVTIPSTTAQWQCPHCQAATAAGAPACAHCGLAFCSGGGPPAIGEDAVVRMLIPVGRSGLAIAAGYAGLLAILPIFAPIALILGILALCDIRNNPDKHGMGRAIFGLVMGILFTLLLVVCVVAIPFMEGP